MNGLIDVSLRVFHELNVKKKCRCPEMKMNFKKMTILSLKLFANRFVSYISMDQNQMLTVFLWESNDGIWAECWILKVRIGQYK